MAHVPLQLKPIVAIVAKADLGSKSSFYLNSFFTQKGLDENMIIANNLF